MRNFDLLWSAINAPGRLFAIVTLFIRMWFGSRRWRDIMLGLPAIIIGGTVAAVVHSAAGIRSSTLAVEYRERAAVAFARTNQEAGELWLQKTIWLDEDQPEVHFSRALAAATHDDLPRARSIMQSIAPADSEGLPEAHFWLARDLIGQKLPLNDDLLNTLDHHLHQAITHQAGASEAHAMLGQVCLARKDLKSAASHFEFASDARPELHLMLAEIYREQGLTTACTTAAERAEAFFAAKAQAEPDEWIHRFRWMQSALKQNRHAAAVRILDERPASMADDPNVHDARVAVYLDWLNYVLESDSHNTALELELLERLLQLEPSHPQAMTMLAGLAVRDDEAARLTDTLLTRALATGTAPTVAHVILGTHALESGDTNKAINHLEIAYARDPGSSILLNNLAWGLAHKDPAEPQRAMSLIDMALKVSQRPRLHGTRAVILAQLDRPKEAITALESVLRIHPDPKWCHKRLAEYYATLGDDALAAEHQRLAE